jgi:molybdate transport system substrate-binding protein
VKHKREIPAHVILLAIVVACPFFTRGSEVRAQGSHVRQVRVAAAADLKFALGELASQFESKTGYKIEATYGSSGNFFSQIQNGAPFDLFFSADVEYPRKLADSGLADASTFREYAIGRMVIWMPPDANVDPAKSGWDALLDRSVQKIAIANPAHAPYGRAAEAALRKAGIYEKIQAKLVYGENISQAAQFVQSGNAQAGIVALSLALSPPMKGGKRWEIPAGLHPPIRQAAIALKRAGNHAAARDFLDFVSSAAGQKILAAYGFAAPSLNSELRPE